MLFRSETGIMNLVLYAKVFDQFRLIARHSTLLLAHGKVERQVTPPKPTSLAGRQSVPIIHVVVSAVERLDRPGGFVAASRDFH